MNAPLSPGRQTLHGSCHCGAVRFSFTADLLANGTNLCNCTMCRKSAQWGVIVPKADFHLDAGAEQLVDAAARTNPFLSRQRCAHCGIEAFGGGEMAELGGAFVRVNLHCVDGVDLSGVPVHLLDGLHDTWAPLRTTPHQDLRAI